MYGQRFLGGMRDVRGGGRADVGMMGMCVRQQETLAILFDKKKKRIGKKTQNSFVCEVIVGGVGK